ncbi:HIT family protein [Acidianus brierleyi]|uniref:HIT family hydrolase n=1 Tax=Acidianus brierleyi TaxID=41673 RepID=A0A2U9IEL9_9CREN|nr:HIT domain-containing protein [Acidianus brierleyi]AWR94481.1 HIT domain-containing protein [Acidianus brierleyi]
MKILWAPWRSTYVSNSSKNKLSECVFCDVIKKSDDRENLIVYRGSKSYIILNKFPYNPGHLMVVPYRHLSSIELLDDEEYKEIFYLVKKSLSALRKLYSPDGFNVGINIGRSAGAGIESHVHVHIVPRWNGDANFMPIISNTKVISDTLDNTYIKLSKMLSEHNEEALDH